MEKIMLMGIKIPIKPTSFLKKTFNEWMGCSRFIWNAKCEEDHYLISYAKKFLPINTYPKIDQKYSQYKDKELSPWLFKCPSQILRNSATNWFKTYQNFLKGLCNKPKRKKKSNKASIHLTKELFYFKKISNKIFHLHIGTKKNPIGYVVLKTHRPFKNPSSLYVIKKHGKYSISFCYEDDLDESKLVNQKEHLKYFKKLQTKDLEEQTIGIDLGVTIPVFAGLQAYDYTKKQKMKKKAKEKYIKRVQKSISRKQKGSKKWKRQKNKIAKAHEKITNIRKDFCHKTSYEIVKNEKTKIIIFEDLQTKNMTKKPKAKMDEKTQKYLPNKKKSKAGLNKAILDKGWHQIVSFVTYKAYRRKKAIFKISANFTSQECADCGHTHPNNRKNQEKFICESCGNSDNADRNAAKVIKKRAIKLIQHSGTELSKRGVLLDSGRGAANKSRKAKANRAYGNETLKKIVKAKVA